METHPDVAQPGGPPGAGAGVPAREPLFRERAGEALRARRHAAGLRLVDVAARAGVAPQYLSEVERGVKDPSSEVLEAIAHALGLGLDALLADVLGRAGQPAAPLLVAVAATPLDTSTPHGWGEASAQPVCLVAA